MSAQPPGMADGGRVGWHSSGLRPAVLWRSMDIFGFRLLLWMGRPALIQTLGPVEAARVAREAPHRLRELLPQIPDLGRPGARGFLVFTCMLVAVRRACPTRSPAEAAQLLGDVFRSGARWVPLPLRRLYRRIFFSPWYHKKLVDGTVGGGEAGFEGHLVKHPGGFGVDYSRCALQHFVRQIGEAELGPEICGLDDVESEIFELGLVRTGTLGRGAKRCDFRWTKPG